ncbi:acyltransferase family protein [Roseiarcus sp.]|uniref:acyltransferase family protein n=1 Tax=Roseiarcus sp. TaxID=1969460 RepID=UPI003F9565C7
MRKSNTRRDGGLDALRASLTLLVLFHHAAITYGASGDWYYKEVRTGPDLSSQLLSLFSGFNQAFFMGLFFLLAGYFTLGAVERHGAAVYIRERAVRLGLPLIIYFLLLSPATMALAATARGRNFFAALVGNWTQGRMEPGPLWFCEALLIFAGLYLAIRAFAPGLARRASPSFPSDVTLALAALGTGVAAFLLRLVWPTGATLLYLQLGYFASYVVLFAAGCLAAPWACLDEAPPEQRRLWITVAWVTFPLMPIAVVLGRHIPWLAGAQSGGWNVQAAVYALWEPFLAWGVILGLLHFYTRRFETLGPLWRSLSRRAYAIYIIHPPVLVALALAWRSAAAPPALKFLVTGTATCLACYLLAGLLLKAPGANKVL